MIYVIDNCEEYDDHSIFLVEAPRTFGVWFKKHLVPWQEKVIGVRENGAWFRVHKLVFVTDRAAWMNDYKPISWSSYLIRNSFLDLDKDSEVPLVPYGPRGKHGVK
jgi:hypothetical protein